ncbi:hypothetical protein CUU64_00690 [Bacillus sp. V5-8f]|nr:hypothetical protein CUU64_00690 [Bacillus sp. V5-8f]
MKQKDIRKGAGSSFEFTFVNLDRAENINVENNPAKKVRNAKKPKSATARYESFNVIYFS